MAKIQRTTQKIFAGNSTNESLAAFGSMKTGTPIYTDNIEDLQTSSYEKGWEDAIVADEAPFLEEMNGVQYVFSKQLAYLFQQGIAEWDAGTTYYTNSFCQVDGKLYYSKQDGNINHSPADDTADEYWTEFKPYTDSGTSGSGFNLFDIVVKDHVLTFEESKGYSLQGTYVYKDAVMGSRYGYPDFYAKCIEEKEAGIETQTTLGDNTITTYNNANGHIFYDIADKAVVDDWFDTYGIADFYGVDEENERIFMPRNRKFFQFTTDTTKVNDMVEAGLPNIEGNSVIYMTGTGEPLTGAFKYGHSNNGWSLSQRTSAADTYLAFDASNSNPIYGKSDTVQPQSSLKLLYYVVGNTEVTSAATDIVDITTSENDTLPLFTGLYFDFKPNHVSWLKAGEQSNSGGIYTTAYNALVSELTLPTYGLKVIDVADMAPDVDYSEYWQVDQDNLTFRTPLTISNKSLSGSVAGDGKSLGWTDGSINAGTRISDYNGIKIITPSQGAYGQNVGTTNNQASFSNYVVAGITTDAENSGIIAQESAAQLYFKVANAVQNLQLLDAGEITEVLADKADADLSNCTKPYVTETYQNGFSWYRVYSDGWCEQGGKTDIQAGQVVTITLLKAFANVNYSIFHSVGTSNYENVWGYGNKVKDITVGSFGLYNNNSTSASLYWKTCGYIS